MKDTLIKLIKITKKGFEGSSVSTDFDKLLKEVEVTSDRTAIDWKKRCRYAEIALESLAFAMDTKNISDLKIANDHYNEWKDIIKQPEGLNQ